MRPARVSGPAPARAELSSIRNALRNALTQSLLHHRAPPPRSVRYAGEPLIFGAK